jgi:ferredoxin
MRFQPSLKDVQTLHIQGNELVVETVQKTYGFPLKHVLEQKCLHCRYPNPIIYDLLVGEPITPRADDNEGYKDIEKIEKARRIQEQVTAKRIGEHDLTQSARDFTGRFEDMDYWHDMVSKCISCGICTFVCPTCYCPHSLDRISAKFL